MPPTTRSMARLYLVLAVVGYLAPGIPTVMESVETGNILFWTDPVRTTTQLFANRTSTAFGLDLFASAFVACIWMVHESARLGVRHAWRFVVLTLLFGLGGTLPLFLWIRENALGTGRSVEGRGQSKDSDPRL
jgi:hypothetical protein